MGRVHRGRVRETDEQVAVKILREDLSADQTVVARFLQEKTILTGLQHPNIVQVRDLVAEGRTLGIVMDFVEGPNLRQVLSEQGTLAPALAIRFIAEVL